MAGAFTHFMICQEALKRASIRIKRLVRGVRPNVYVGAVSPDIPYLAVLQETSSLSCADYMHYIKTNGIAEAGVNELHKLYFSGHGIDRPKASWLLGYVSHLIVDATIHPIVKEIVGPYEKNKSEHLLCEMVQDAFVFKLLTGREILDSEFIQRKLNGIDPDILKFWRTLFYRTYFPKYEDDRITRFRRSAKRPKETTRDLCGRRFRIEYLENSIKPRRWLGWYQTLLNFSTSGRLKNLARDLKLRTNLSYRTTVEINRKTPADRELYFEKVQLPNRTRRAHFMQAGFEKSVKHVLTSWEVVMDGIASGKVITGFIKDWDLDTGEDHALGGVTFWS